MVGTWNFAESVSSNKRLDCQKSRIGWKLNLTASVSSTSISYMYNFNQLQL